VESGTKRGVFGTNHLFAVAHGGGYAGILDTALDRPYGVIAGSSEKPRSRTLSLPAGSVIATYGGREVTRLAPKPTALTQRRPLHEGHHGVHERRLTLQVRRMVGMREHHPPMVHARQPAEEAR
jgi:hypothetical protein